jgi:SAM-dependent methyltransferase
MCEREVADSIRKQFGSNVEILIGSPERLPLRASFDLVIYRGAFFFLTPEIIKETYRVLKPTGRALLGGGYGPLTPSEEIAKIAEESKRLNKRWSGWPRWKETARSSRKEDSGCCLKKYEPALSPLDSNLSLGTLILCAYGAIKWSHQKIG